MWRNQLKYESIVFGFFLFQIRRIQMQICHTIQLKYTFNYEVYIK